MSQKTTINYTPALKETYGDRKNKKFNKINKLLKECK